MTEYYRRHEYKIYTAAGVYIKTLSQKEILSEFDVTNQINGGQSDLTVRLDRPFDDFNNDSICTYNNVLKVYELSNFHPNGVQVYTGYLVSIDPSLEGTQEYVELTFFPAISKLKNDMLRTGSVAYAEYTSDTDVSSIIEDVLDNYRASVTNPIITYTSGTSVETSTSEVQTSFTDCYHLDAIERAAKFLPSNWYYYLDETGLFNVHAQSATADHTFTIGKDVVSIKTHKTIEDLENYFVLWNGLDSTDANYLRTLYTDTDSVTAYETHTRRYEIDGRITVATTANAKGNRYIALGKDPHIRTTIGIAANYDHSTIKPGNTCKIRNYDATDAVYSDAMLIVRVRQAGDVALLDLAQINADVGKLFQSDLTEQVRTLQDQINNLGTSNLLGGGISVDWINDKSILGWLGTMTFSATDYNTVAWTSGSVIFSNGDEYAITAGNTGNIAALTYIYLDPAVSTTVLQKTTTAATAVGANKLMVAIAKDNADTGKLATFNSFGGNSGMGLTVIEGMLAADAVTANEINVASLSAIQANLGNVSLAGTDGMDVLTGGDIEMFSSASDAASKSTISFYTGTPASPTQKAFMQLYKEGAGSQLLLSTIASETTSMRFDTDYGILYSSPTHTFQSTGLANTAKMYLNDTANTKNTYGFTINQQAADDEALSFKSSDVNHGMTDVTEGDTYGMIGKNNATTGGIMVKGVSENVIGMVLAALATNEDTSTATTSYAAMYIDAFLKSGTGVTGLGATANLLAIANNGTTRFIFDGDGDAYADSGWGTYSDARLKSDIEPLDDCLDVVMRISPKRYTRHKGKIENGKVKLEAGKSKPDVGIIAQELESIIPEAVRAPTGPDSFYTMFDAKLIPYLIGAIQTLSDKITNLEKRK